MIKARDIKVTSLDFPYRHVPVIICICPKDQPSYLIQVNEISFLHDLDTGIRIYNECEDGIEKSVPRITVWYHMAWLVCKKDKLDHVDSF